MEESLQRERLRVDHLQEEWLASRIEVERQRRRLGKEPEWKAKLSRGGAGSEIAMVFVLLSEDELQELESHVESWSAGFAISRQSFQVDVLRRQDCGEGLYLAVWKIDTIPDGIFDYYSLTVQPLDLDGVE